MFPLNFLSHQNVFFSQKNIEKWDRENQKIKG